MDIFAEFIGKKVNRVRWKPDDLMASTMFVTGSWDNEDVRLIYLHVDFYTQSFHVFIFPIIGQRNRIMGTDIGRRKFGQRFPSKTFGLCTTKWKCYSN